MPTLYLITKEVFGFLTIFDALAASRYGVGRNADTLITDPAIPDIPVRLALSWDAQNPLTPLKVQPFIGPPEATTISTFASILTDQNISDLQEFRDFGYAVYEIAPGGALIDDFEILAQVYGYLSEGFPSTPSDLINQKIAVFGNDTLEVNLVNSGVITVRISVDEVVAALEAGTIDGVLSTDAAILNDLTSPRSEFFTADVGNTGISNIDDFVIGSEPENPIPDDPLPDSIDEDGLYIISAYSSFEISSYIIQASDDPDFRFVVPVQIFLMDGTGAYIEYAGQRWRIGDQEGTYAIPATTAAKHGALLTGEAQALIGDGEDVADFWQYRSEHLDYFSNWHIYEVDPASQTLIYIPINTTPLADDGPNTLHGDEHDNSIAGLGGDDELRGNGGNDMLDGGTGDDLAVYSGPQSAYTIRFTPSGQTVEDRRPNHDGTDTLTSIETLVFSGDEWPLDIFSGVGNLSEEDLREFVEVYIAYFNRAPDAEGLFFYGTAFANGTSLEACAATFLNSVEYQSTYPPGLSNHEFAEAVYNNVLGRIPDPLGFAFWVNVLDTSARSRDVFILEVLAGAKAPAPADATIEFIAQKTADLAYLSNKTDIGLYFATTKGMSNVSNANEVMQIFASGDPTDITAAVNAIDAFHNSALDPDNGEFLLQLVGVVDDPFVA
ncbi:protein of unknown function [Thalassovita litoralis]|uniref:DUF4214 domain-containing protein n=1 Tax=Thalassovita litoralis TaxID=1010611 RepID=A0A521EVN7_9RHOB|nr:DUF4214 domain-containing protein [Thalassovita litoralis]SMO88008.1 protein of unknown function [Thalassovita litoralis]